MVPLLFTWKAPAQSDVPEGQNGDVTLPTFVIFATSSSMVVIVRSWFARCPDVTEKTI